MKNWHKDNLKESGSLERQAFLNTNTNQQNKITMKHYDEPLFDYIIIRETGEFSEEGYKTARLFGVNYEDESKEIPCGYIDCFTVSPSCQFDFHKNGGITVFCKGYYGIGRKVFARNSFTGSIIAMGDCEEN